MGQGETMKLNSILAIFFTLLIHSQTNAFALPTQSKLKAEDVAFIELMSDQYNFEGIVKLDNCSGALVRFENSDDSSKAMVMTNGHCVSMGPFGGFIKPGEALINKPAKRSFRFLNQDGSMSSNGVNSTQILYATMTGTDVALYELELTFAQILKKFGVHALTIESQHPSAGEPIQILSGYWQKGYSCEIDGFVFKLKEDDYVWDDSIRYTEGGCKTIHGTSGSPILSARSGKVIGINNTGSDNGEECTMNNPCEQSNDGSIFVKKGLSYGQQTYRFYGCMNASGKLDMNTRGCDLLH